MSLEIDSVNLSFGGRQILSNVYLSCEPGQVVGILGRNGSGKSCLLKLIFGSLRGNTQSVRLNGKYYDQLYKRPGSVHFVPQDGMLMDYLRLSDLIKIFDLEDKLEELMEIEEIKKAEKSQLRELSDGMKKFIEMIVILYTNVEYVLLDEPFSFLSPVLSEKLVQHIIKQKQNKGIILTDHQYETVWQVSDKKYVLYNQIVREVKHKEELEKYGYLRLK